MARQSARVSDARRKMDELAALLRAAGLRRTAPRVAVLERLARVAGPISHGELCDELEALGFDRATVYRNLVDLVEAGLVRRSDFGDHVWRFELVRDQEHARQHPHLVCTDCGRVSCLPDVQVSLTTVRGRSAPRASEVEVQLRGLCQSCSA